MVAPLIRAIAGGFTANSILKLVAKKFPKMAPTIHKAQEWGFTNPMILRSLFGKNGDDAEQYMTEREKTRRNFKRQQRDALLMAGAAAGTVGAGVYGLSKLGQAAKAAQGVQPPQIGGGTPPPGGGGGNMPPPGGASPTGATTPQTPPPGAPPAGQNPAQGLNKPPGSSKSQMMNEIRKNVEDISDSLPTRTEKEFPYLPNFVNRHLLSGMKPQEVYDLARQSKMLTPIIDKIEKETGKSYLERINRMSGIKPSMPKETSATEGELIPSEKTGDLSKSPMGALAALGNIVITPQGSGTVHKVHGDNAYVEVDNKLQKVPVSEIEPPAESAVETVNRILNIPESERSSNVALFAWNPEERRAYFQFHDEDAFYEYLDVDPQIVDAIAEKRAIPKTSGGNQYGEWSPEDRESIGAALWKYIISTPKYAKSKKEQPANPNYRKLPIKYDYWKALRKMKKRKP